jgi:hypothetical protein
MTNLNQKDEIIRFVLESSAEENEKLASFMTGIRVQGRSFGHGQPKKEKTEDAGLTTSLDASNGIRI